jgi:hypothetical protein
MERKGNIRETGASTRLHQFFARGIGRVEAESTNKYQ